MCVSCCCCCCCCMASCEHCVFIQATNLYMIVYVCVVCVCARASVFVPSLIPYIVLSMVLNDHHWLSHLLLTHNIYTYPHFIFAFRKTTRFHYVHNRVCYFFFVVYFSLVGWARMKGWRFAFLSSFTYFSSFFLHLENVYLTIVAYKIEIMAGFFARRENSKSLIHIDTIAWDLTKCQITNFFKNHSEHAITKTTTTK